MRTSLAAKFNLLTIGVVLITAVGIGSLVMYREVTTTREELVQRGLITAAMLAQASEYGVYTENLETLRRVVVSAYKDPNFAYIVVMNADNNALIQEVKDQGPTGMLTHAPQANGSSSSEILDPSSGKQYIDIHVPIVSQAKDNLFSDESASQLRSRTIGHLRLGLSEERLRAELYDYLLWIGSVTFLVVLVGIVGTLLRIRNIIRPIQSLVTATGQIARGDFQQSVRATSNDEIGTLAESFNGMAQQLASSHAEVQKYQNTLEAQVEERTRKLEEKTREAVDLAQKAQAASQAKTEFLANMSHEVRTPLNGIMGMTQLLRHTPLTEKQQRFVDIADRSCVNLLDVVNDILDFSKIEAGKLQLEHSDFDLQELIGEVMDLFAHRVQSKQIELLSRIEEAVPTHLCGDMARLRQILVNLLGNAVKFTERGEIGVTVSCVEERSEQVQIRVEVRDTGIGIAPAVHEKIFEAFSQADGSTTRKFGGTGLGLTIVKQLVHLMKGTLGLESSLGAGSMFWFQVPLKPSSNPGLRRIEASDVFRRMRVLVVDDNATNQHILDQYLNGWGIAHVTVSSGKEAIEILQRTIGTKEMYDLAIIDGQMPEMDGFELARAIRAETRLGMMKIIMLTSMGQDERLLASEHAGDIDCAVAKPVRQSHLYNRLLGLTTMAESQVEPTEAAPVDTSHPECRTDVSILVAEDNPVNREAAAEMLEINGYRVQTVCNGREAVEAMASQTFDVVFMDCQMPVMDGFTATAAIRARERDLGLARVPIVALTAHATAGDRERCLAHDMDDYLSKPFRQPQLIAVVQRWVLRGASSSSMNQADANSHATLAGPLSESQDCLDERALRELRALRRPGRRDIYVDMLSRFLESSRSYMETMRQQITVQNETELSQTAHSLKSSSGMVGARLLAERLKELEVIATSGELSSAPAAFTKVEREYVRVRRAIEGLLAKEAA